MLVYLCKLFWGLGGGGGGAGGGQTRCINFIIFSCFLGMKKAKDVLHRNVSVSSLNIFT